MQSFKFSIISKGPLIDYMNIYIVLVAYNTDVDFLCENLINNSKYEFVICNNGDSKLCFLASENVTVFDFNQNLGIAAAQSKGMKYAFDSGADYVVQVDDDSIIDSKLIDGLVARYKILRENNINVGLVAPKHFDKIDKQVDEKRLPKGHYFRDFNVTSVHATISSCSIISKDVYKVVGGMEDDLFIDYVDWEYCWRIKDYGFDVFRVEDLLLAHRVGNGKKKIIGSIDARIPSPIRHYYHTRNTILLFFRSYSPKRVMIKELFKIPVKVVIYPFVFSNGLERLKFLSKGILDGILGRKGMMK